MRKSTSGFEAELRIPIEPVIAALMILSVALFLLSDSQADPSEWVPTVLLALSLFAVAGAAGLVDNWKPEVSRRFTVVALVALVHLGNMWLGRSVFLALIGVPSALAVALIGPLAAAVTAVGETMLLLLLPSSGTAGLDLHIVASLVAIWAVLGVVYAMYHRVYQQSRWVEEYSDRTQRSLEEARDRKAELDQTLKSLAHANRQLAMNMERMAALRTIAEGAQKTKTMFLAKVSHEFRTPLNMIIGLIELIVETPEMYAVELPPEMEKDLGVVLRNCRHLSSMIDDVLDLTRIETGRVTLHKEWVNLGDIIDEAVTVVLPLVDKKGLALRVTVPDDFPAVYCDRTRIRQVVLNLVSNAARFTEQGSISVDAVVHTQHVEVRVTDTGPGVAPEDVERIFEPFSQGASDMWRDKGGSGLGLSISQQFVRLHHGRLWLESEVGVGSSFVFELPMSSPMEHIARPEHRIREDWAWRERAFRASQGLSSDQLTRPRVVICDDTDALYPWFARYSDAVEFVDARDLAQTVRELQRCPAHVVVFNGTDFHDLWTRVETFREKAPGTPVIGCSVPRQVERAIDAGALGHLIKPVTCADLEQAVRAVGGPVKRVLVVDDDPDVLRLFSRMLRVRDGALEIVTASNGERALDELRRRPPDLMLLDVVMPGMDGWQVLEAIAADEEIGAVPTLFVSAQDPADQQPVSGFLLVTMDGGLSLSQLLRCSLELSALLLKSDGEPVPMPPRTAGAV